MRVLFNYPRTIDGAHYPKGQHALSNKIAEHWYLKALVKSGDAIILDKSSLKKEDLESGRVEKPKTLIDAMKSSAAESPPLIEDDISDEDFDTDLDDESVEPSDEGEDLSGGEAEESKPLKKANKKIKSRNHKGK